MDNQRLIENLHRAGMACFVRYYECADDPALAQRIEEAESYTYKSCRSRVRRLRMIIRNGRGKDVLAIIAKSRNVDAETRKKADDLLACA